MPTNIPYLLGYYLGLFLVCLLILLLFFRDEPDAARRLKKRLLWAFPLAALLFFLMPNNARLQNSMALTSSKPSLEQTQQELDQIEVFRTLKSKDRATYDAIAATIYRNVEQNQSFDTTVWQAIQALDASLQKYIVRTSDTALRNYLNALTIQLKTLRAHDPNLCYHILYQPQGRLEEMNKVLQQSRRQEQAVMSALNQVILDYDPARPLPSEAETQIYLEATFLKISEKYGADAGMLANPTAPGTDKAKLCDMSIDLFDTLMAYPDPHATNSWKVLLSTE